MLRPLPGVRNPEFVVYYCRTYEKAVSGGGEREKGQAVPFGLWRVRFPPCLVRPGRRLPVQGLREGSLGFRDSYPRGGARDRVEALSPELPEIKEKSGIWNLVPVG